jgi:hypothetical protein
MSKILIQDLESSLDHNELTQAYGGIAVAQDNSEPLPETVYNNGSRTLQGLGKHLGGGLMQMIKVEGVLRPVGRFHPKAMY